MSRSQDLRFQVPSDSCYCAFSDSLSVVSSKQGAFLLDLETHSTQLFHTEPFSLVDLRKNALLTASSEFIRFFDITNPSPVLSLATPSVVTALALHPSANAFFTASLAAQRTVVSLHDPRQHSPASIFQCSEFSVFPVTQISVSGDLLAAASSEGVDIFDRRRPTEALASYALPKPSACLGLDWSSINNNIFFAISGGNLWKYTLRGDKLHRVKIDLPYEDVVSIKVVPGLPYSAAVVGRKQGRVGVLDLTVKVEVETYQAHKTAVSSVGCALSLTAFDQVKVASFSAGGSIRVHTAHLPASRTSMRQGSESPTLYTGETARSPRRTTRDDITILPPTTDALLEGFKRCCARLAGELKAQLYPALAGTGQAAYTVKLATQELILTLKEVGEGDSVVVEYAMGKQQGEFDKLNVHDVAQGAFQDLLKHVLRVIPIAAASGIARLPSDRPFPATAGICWSPKGDLYRFQNAQIKNVERLTFSYFQPEVHDEEQCVQVINAAHFEDRIDDHWFATAAQRVAISGQPGKIAETNFNVCMQLQAKVRNDNARMVAEAWTLMRQLFTSASGLAISEAEPVLPVIEDTELGASVGRALVEDCMKRLFAAEQTQALALVAALLHLNRIRPLRAFGKAKRVEPPSDEGKISVREPESRDATPPEDLHDVFDESATRSPRIVSRSEAKAGYLSRKMVRSASLLNFNGSQSLSMRASLSEIQLNKRNMSSGSINNPSDPEISFEYEFPCGYEPHELHTAGVGLVWRGPLTPRDPTVIEPMLYALHAHAEVFQQLGRYAASRLLEKIIHLYRPDWPLVLLSEDDDDDFHSEIVDMNASAPTVACAICALPLHGLFGLCPDCGRAIHLNKHARCVCNSSSS